VSCIVTVQLAENSVAQQLQNTDHRRCVRQTAHISESDEWSRRRRASETSWQSSARYDGAWPARHWNTREENVALAVQKDRAAIWDGVLEIVY